MSFFTPAFLAAHIAIEGHTLVDAERCFDLWNLSEEAAKVEGDIIEVGVWRGGTGFLLCKRAIEFHRRHVYLCDTFSGVVKTGEHDPHYHGGEHADTSIETVESLLARHGLSNWTILQGVFPDETGEQVADKQFCFAHIDVDAYESARDALDFIWPRMPVGGIVVFDDYLWPSTPGITRLIEERRFAPDRLFISNVRWHAAFIKTRA